MGLGCVPDDSWDGLGDALKVMGFVGVMCIGALILIGVSAKSAKTGPTNNPKPKNILPNKGFAGVAPDGAMIGLGVEF